jgi:hypothetical protein
MSLSTIPQPRRRNIPDSLQEMIRYERDQFFYELQTVIEVAGGRIPIERLQEMTLGEILDSLTSNNIEFEIRPIIKMHGDRLGDESYIERLHEVASRAQEIREEATSRHAEARRNL